MKDKKLLPRKKTQDVLFLFLLKKKQKLHKVFGCNQKCKIETLCFAFIHNKMQNLKLIKPFQCCIDAFKIFTNPLAFTLC